MEPLKVVELKVNSFMGIDAAQMEIGPEGMILIGGNNGAGKSSLISAIECAIRGKKWHPNRPVKDGAKQAEVVLDLGALKIRRRFKPDGTGTLHVENADGYSPKQPQAMLDALAGAIAFNPLEFSTMHPKEQLELVRELAGIDTTELDVEANEAFDARTEVKREVTRLQGQFDSMPHHEDAPDEPVSVVDLMTELERRETVNHDNQTGRDHLDELKSRERHWEGETAKLADQISDLQAQLEDTRGRLKDAGVAVEKQQIEVSYMTDELPVPIKHQIQMADGRNAKHRDNAARDKVGQSLQQANISYSDFTNQLDELKIDRANLIASADMPIDGLEIGEDGLEFQGTPFAQASSAERLRTSIAMGMALHPKLSVMLVRDGEKLDDSGLALVAEMAKENDYQVWVERVGDKDAGAIVIKDGRIDDAPRLDL